MFQVPCEDSVLKFVGHFYIQCICLNLSIILLHVCCVTLSVPLTAFKEKLSLTFLVLKVIKKIVVEGYETRLRRGRKMISGSHVSEIHLLKSLHWFLNGKQTMYLSTLRTMFCFVFNLFYLVLFV